MKGWVSSGSCKRETSCWSVRRITGGSLIRSEAADVWGIERQALNLEHEAAKVPDVLIRAGKAPSECLVIIRQVEDGDLEKLDRAGYRVLDALSYVRSPTKVSANTPHLFLCMDGKSYWIKHGAQQGLISELVAGRLAARAEAGPDACVVRVPQEALTETGAPAALAGVHVGSLDVPAAVNARDLDTIGVESLAPEQVKAAFRARVVAFQTWIGAGDSQVLLDMGTGRIFSVDHGDVFADTSTLSDPTPIITEIPGIETGHGCKADFIEKAVKGIESINDDEILERVACIPQGGDWRSERPRRLEIAKWLAHRRSRLREGMKAWT